MIGIDENILYKYMTGDSSKAFKGIRSDITKAAHGPGVYISMVMLMELSRLLRNHKKERVIEAMLAMLTVAGFEVENPEVLVEAIKMFAKVDAPLQDCIQAAVAGSVGVSMFITEKKSIMKYDEGLAVSSKS